MFESKLSVYTEKIVNLTALITIMEQDPDSYTQVQIEEVKIVIKQVEALIVELQASIQTSTEVLISIRKEVIIHDKHKPNVRKVTNTNSVMIL